MSHKILVVDDDDVVRDVLMRYLGGLGYEVCEAVDGVDALEVFVLEGPDLLVIDRQMPRMDGYELCHRIRAISNVPLIMISALALSDQEALDLSSYVVAFLLKPFDLDELEAKIGESLTNI